jgi:endonuclease YncB( thermonuclease family)
VGSDKYPKRIHACVSIDGRDLGDSLIAAGLARPYSGGHGDGCANSPAAPSRIGRTLARNGIAAKKNP